MPCFWLARGKKCATLWHLPAHGIKYDLEIKVRGQLLQVQSIHEFAGEGEQSLQAVDIRCGGVKSAETPISSRVFDH